MLVTSRKEDPMSKTTSIAVITTTDSSDTKGALPFQPNLPKSISVESSVMTDNLRSFMENFQQVFEAESSANSFYIDEIELSLAVNASGGLELIGKTSVGMEGGIKVKLKRNGSVDPS